MINRLHFYIKLFLGYVGILNSIVFRTVIKTLNLQKFFFYPKSIYKLSKQIKLEKKVKSFDFNYSNNSKFLKNFEDNLQIKIFDQFIKINSSFSWQNSSNDIEEKCALGRWHWLIDNDFNNQKFKRYEEGLFLVRLWIVNCKNDNISKNPYEISERITNFIYFLLYHKKTFNEVPEDIKNYLDKIAFILANNIEFNNEDLSGNHIVNNARALIVYGYYFNLDSYFNLGKELMLKIIPKLIRDKFFLRESSSHYQYLFTSWIFEVHIIFKEKNERQLSLLLENYLSDLINGCLFFNTGNEDQYVTIGDISPDKTPKWLENITSLFLSLSKKKDINKFETGWASMINKIFNLNKYNFYFLENKFDDFCYFKEAGYLKLKKFKWLVFKHIEKDTDLIMASHAHHDFTSFVVYYDNKEVLIDPGRLNYTDTNEGKYGKSAKAHNVMIIDGYPASLSKVDRHIPKIIKKRKFDIRFKNEQNFFEIDLIHNGFKHINQKIKKHRRKIIIENKSINMSDTIDGEGKIDLNSYFHFPVNLVINNKNETKSDEICLDFNFDTGNKNLNSLLKVDQYSSSYDPFLGWRFQSYGNKAPAKTMVLSGNFVMPIKLNYRLILKTQS